MTDKEVEKVLYTSKERGCFYNWIRILWCACCEDSHKITTKYVRIHKWEGCNTVTDSMAMEAISDVTREQPCCCFLASCCCRCCISDFGNIRLYGADETNEHGVFLKNVANSASVHKALTAHLQQLHKHFRQTGKNFGMKLQKVRQEDKIQSGPHVAARSALH